MEKKICELSGERLFEAIKEVVGVEGSGSAVKWDKIVTSAISGDKNTIAVCEEMLGRKPKVSDLYLIRKAATEIITDSELNALDSIYTQALNSELATEADATAYISTKLSILRKAKKLTQKEVAEKIGSSLITYQRYENGTSNLLKANVTYVVRLAQVLGVTVEDIVGKFVN